MSDELKMRPNDARPAYEPPRAVRMDDRGPGAGLCNANGSGDVGDCTSQGLSATVNCNANGNLPGGACNANGTGD